MFSRWAIGAGAAASTLALVLAPVAGTATTSRSDSGRPMIAQDVARTAGFREAHIRTWSAAPGDFNRDGAEDVLINYHGYANGERKVGAKLWRNRGGGGYRRVAPYLFPSVNPQRRLIDRHNCDWADVDRNGQTDLYCSAGQTEHNIVKHGRDNELWLQNRYGLFREVGTAWRAGDPCGRGRIVTFLRANRDRYPDLFVGNDRPRLVPDPCDSSSSLPNEKSKLFLNVRGQSFRRAPHYWNSSSGSQGRGVPRCSTTTATAGTTCSPVGNRTRLRGCS